ncbi:hypothetical protein ACQY0O_000645 [Thecaphora frezii]
MPRVLKNRDGTVNLDAVSRETSFLKGKYAQNAANLQRNQEAEPKQQHEQQQPEGGAQAETKHGNVVPPEAAQQSQT